MIADRMLRDLLPTSFTAVPCVSIQRQAKIEEAIGLLIPYLESMADSLIVTGDSNEPIGVVGGREIVEKVLANPSRSVFEGEIEKIMSPTVTHISGTSTIRNIIQDWQKTGRAFSILPNALGGFSVISARKMLEVGKISMTDMRISELPKKKIHTFSTNSTINEVINAMLKNKTRKILLENTNQFVSDRIIIEKIASDLNYLRNTGNFLDLPVTGFGLEYAKVITKDIMVNELASIMFGMQHPYAVYHDQVISPWDICLALLSERMEEYD
ncbi:MAG: CBS domain-containing protein [Thaumarchaeota archaeon]|nr:CBS domain-containing protein [Nitrososphaerota archaeon]